LASRKGKKESNYDEEYVEDRGGSDEEFVTPTSKKKKDSDDDYEYIDIEDKREHPRYHLRRRQPDSLLADLRPNKRKRKSLRKPIHSHLMRRRMKHRRTVRMMKFPR